MIPSNLLRLQVERVEILSKSPETVEIQLVTHPQLPKSFYLKPVEALDLIMKLADWAHPGKG